MQDNEESRQWIMTKVRSISKALDYDALDEEAFDTLVHEAAAEGASAVNNCGIPSQIEYLLRHGWAAEDIVCRLNSIMHEDEFDATAEYIKGHD